MGDYSLAMYDHSYTKVIINQNETGCVQATHPGDQPLDLVMIKLYVGHEFRPTSTNFTNQSISKPYANGIGVQYDSVPLRTGINYVAIDILDNIPRNYVYLKVTPFCDTPVSIASIY